jgi:hypothetical protein
MTKTQHLTLAGVKRAARRAYRARRLTAQHPTPTKRMCVYEKGSYSCAIGAALNKHTIAAIRESNCNEGTSVDQLRVRGLITVDADELGPISVIQNMHDSWASASEAYGGRSDGTKSARKGFLETIGLKS